MQSLEEQKAAARKQHEKQKKEQQDLDLKQMEYTNAKDEEWKKREERKTFERRQHAQNLMNETAEKNSGSGGKRGEKMTKEELRFNKELLKEVSKIKKQGNFNSLLEQCQTENNKITNLQ